MERRDFHHVNQQEIKVTIETNLFRITGDIEILINHSATDELNNDKAFIEVRNADIIDRASGKVINHIETMALSKQCILVLYKIA